MIDMKTELTKLLYIFLMTLSAVGCGTDVDLCYEGNHPHRGQIQCFYHWGDQRPWPDSMYVLANRIIGQWKSSMVVGTNTVPSTGFYLNTDFERTSFSDKDFLQLLDSLGIGDQYLIEYAGYDFSTDKFAIRNGEYKFLTFSMDTTELIYNNVREYMMAPASERRVLQDLTVEYKTYNKDHNKGELRSLIAGWTDYNPYADYIQPEMLPVFFDTTQVVSIGTNQLVPLHFNPQPLTQNIDIYFNIKKDMRATPFVIDSVRAEVSGIPRSVNLSNGYLDIEHTVKMMFRMSMCSPFNLSATPPYETPRLTDNLQNTQIGCHANIDVTSVVRNISSEVYTGPGIIQIMVWTHAIDPETGLVNRKKMQGKINIYNTLEQSKLLKPTPDGSYMVRSQSHGNIVIHANVEIDGSKILRGSDNTGGLDNWVPCDDIIVDI